MKPMISVHGSYFCNNYGDLLLIEIFCKWIHELYPDAIINFPMASDSAAIELPCDTTRSFVNLLKSRCLVFVGGGYFGEKPNNRLKWSIRNFYRHIVPGLFASLFKIPIAIIGVEFGPLSVPFFRRSVIRLAKNAKIVVARNHESYMFLKEHGIDNAIESADAVLSLSDLYTPEIIEQRKVLYHMPDSLGYIKSIKSFVQLLCLELKEMEIDNIDLVEDGPHEDGYYNEFFHFFTENGVNFHFTPYSSIGGLIYHINQSSYIITHKLHVGITGLALNKRVFCLYSHPKAVRLHQQVGNDYYCLSVKEDDSVIKDRLHSFFCSPPYNLPDLVKKKAMINNEELVHFLKSL